MASDFIDLNAARILVVASDLRLRQYLAELLLQSFATVQFVQSGQEAITQLSNNKFEVVISDFFLMDMDGVEFRQQMIEKTSVPRFILLTAHATDPRIQQRLQMDHFTVLQKPPHPDELIFTIRSWFRPRKAA